MLNRLAAAAALALVLATPAFADTLVVTAARMVDVERGRYVDNPVVVVTDGRITAVGTAVPAGLPADARRLDLPGLTLLPGLIAMHVHLASTPYVSGWNELDYADDFGAILQVVHARANLMAGFTTVRNLGGPEFADVALRQAIDGGFVEAFPQVPRSALPAAIATSPACPTPWPRPIRSTPTASRTPAMPCARCANTAPR